MGGGLLVALLLGLADCSEAVTSTCLLRSPNACTCMSTSTRLEAPNRHIYLPNPTQPHPPTKQLGRLAA